MNFLFLTGLGEDFTLHYNSQPIIIWETEGDGYWLKQLAFWRTKGYYASRCGFVFPGLTGMSVLDYAKFDRLLELFADIDVKVIPLLQNNDASFNGYSMSQDLWDNWITFTQHYKSDHRIAAISLFSEPTPNTMPAGKTDLEQTQYFADLTRAIHQIDPERVVIFPIGQYCYGSAQEWIADLQQVGIVDEPNVVFDIVHPYFFENSWDMGLTPEQKAVWYGNTWIQPFINAFGAKRCWSGETFAWRGTVIDGSHEADPVLQSRWLTAIINEFVKREIGFDIWALIGNGDAYRFQTPIMAASNYQPSGEPPPPPPDHEPPVPPTPSTIPIIAAACIGIAMIWWLTK